MNRMKIENVLMEMGVPAGIKGFTFIADAVEYINKNGVNISVTKELYPYIAKKNDATPSRVERAIRHAFEVVRSPKGNYEVVEKYIGFMNCANFSSLVMLYKKIKQECKETREVKKKEEISEPTTAITASEIREICRQELRLVLDELKRIAT